MLSRSLILFFASGAVVSAAEQSPSAFEIHAPRIPGLEVEVGETSVIPDAKSAMAFGFKDGRICAYGDGTQSIWSEDHGKTWKPGSLGPSYKMTIQLSTGEVLSFQRDLIPRSDGKHTVRYQRLTDSWQTVEQLEGVADVPLATSMGTDNGGAQLPSMLMQHGITELPNGDLLAALEGNYKGDSAMTDAYPPEYNTRKSRTVVISSSDQGKTWVNPITVAFDTMLGALNKPDLTGSKFTIVPAVTQEGFCEAGLAVAPNGDVICLMRSGGASGEGIMTIFPTPMYLSRSSDYGKTWTPPVGVADRGSQPGVITLENGVLVCTYVRPGVWIIFSDDNGQTWKGATQIDVGKRYSYIVAAGPDSFMVFRERPDDRAIVATRFTVRKS